MFRRRAPPPTFHPGLAELRDVFGPGDAERVGAELGREPHFAADLLRIRPWLDPRTAGREVPLVILESQWSGLIALLHERGPWVYAASQRCSEQLRGRRLSWDMRGRAYSVELRERIVRAVQRGQPHAEVARRFEVSVATVERYARLAREGRGLAPRPRPGRAVVAIGPGALPLLAAQVQEAPDLTLAEHLARWRERHGATQPRLDQHLGAEVSRVGHHEKKRPSAPVNVTKGCASNLSLMWPRWRPNAWCTWTRVVFRPT